MVEKEIKIKVSTETDTSQVQDLQEIIERLQNEGAIQFETNVNVEDIETLQTELEEAKSTVEDLETELAGIEMGTIDGDFDAVAQELSEAQTRVQELSTAFDEVGQSADTTTTEIEEMQGSIDLLNAQALLGIGQEISSLGSQAEGMAQDMNTAAITVGQLAKQTGIAEPQMVSLINNISNATFPNEEAMMYVKSLDQIGVSSGNLGKSATDLDKINDAFGLGASKVNSLGQELSVLGVDMNNVSSSFNALAYANANTVGGMDNYYSFLRKYDAQFKELGYNVDQSSVIIAGATQKFGGGRAALTGLSDALKESDGDARKLEEALGLEAGAISNASQITSEYEGQLQSLADEEAEHKTILDQINAAWEDMSLTLSPALSPLASFMGLIGQVGGWAVGVNGINTLVESLTGLNILESVGGKFSVLKGKLFNVGSAARTAGSNILNLARNLGSTVLTGVKNAASAFLTLSKNVLTAGFNALKSAGMWLIQKAQMAASTIATWAATAAQAALNFVMSLNPIILLIIAIVALIAVLGYLYFNNEQVRAAVDGLGQTFVMIGQLIYTSFVNAINWVISALQSLWNYILTLGGLLPANVNLTGNQIIDTILRVILFISTLPLQIGIIFTNIIAKTLGFGNNFVQRMMTAGVNSVTRFMGQISSLPGKFMAELNSMLSYVGQWAATLPAKFWEAGVNAVKNFLNALGIHSPGTMQRTLVWEISEMAKRTPVEGRALLSNISDLGSDVVNSFGNPKLSLGYDKTLNADLNKGKIGLLNNKSDTYIFNLYGDMDNEERMKKFVDAVRKEIAFDNRTAGRTV